MTTAQQTGYPITIDYGQSVAEMVAAGKYDYANRYITAENCPITGEGSVHVETVLLHPDRFIESDDVVKEMGKAGLEPARLEHLLAFDAAVQEQLWQFPIVALGSSWVNPKDGSRYVPCLSRWVDERELNLGYWDGGWDGSYRFLAVRKK